MDSNLLRPILIQITIWILMSGTRLAAPLLALKQGYGPGTVGLLVALFALSPVFLALPAGKFMDRRGVKLPVAVMSIAAGVGVCIAAAFPTLPSLALAALLAGASAGVVMIGMQRHVGQAARNPDELKKAFSWLAIAPAVGNFAGAFGAGMLIDHAGGEAGSIGNYQITFLALGSSVIACCWLLHGLVALPVETHESETAEGDGKQPSLLRSKDFRLLLLANWLQGMSWDLHNLGVPLLGHERGLSASTIGILMGLFAVSAAAVRVVLPALAKRADERDIITCSTVATALLLGLYPFLSSALTMGICSCLLGLAMGAVQPMVMSLLHRGTPASRRGEALGLRTMTVSASSVVFPMMLGALGAAFGMGSAFWIVGGALAAGSPAMRKLEPGRGESV
ncbi:MFS transporter [soil metagenome]